jgi:hypothetical protein
VIDDVVQEVLEWVVEGNRDLLHNRDLKIKKPLSAQVESPYLWPILDPLGSHDDFLADVLPFSGPSDNEDLNSNTLRVHSVMLNDFPDPLISVYQDTPETADPTQMKRVAVIGAITLWALANAGPREAEQLAVTGFTRAGERIKIELRKAIKNIVNSEKKNLPKKALDSHISLESVIDKEVRALKEIEPWLEGDTDARAYVEYLANKLISEGEEALEIFNSFHHRRAEILGIPAVFAERSKDEKALRNRVPVRADRPLGPVNINRYRYGQAWLARKIGNWDFLNLDIRNDGYFVHYELLNFVNGKRDLLQIRDAVSAEFGLIPAKNVAEYFEVLEQAGIISFCAS